MTLLVRPGGQWQQIEPIPCTDGSAVKNLGIRPPTEPDGYHDVRFLFTIDGRTRELKGSWNGEHLVVCEQVGMELDDSDELPEEQWHNCDAMGCGCEHVMLRVRILGAEASQQEASAS